MQTDVMTQHEQQQQQDVQHSKGPTPKNSIALVLCTNQVFLILQLSVGQ